MPGCGTPRATTSVSWPRPDRHRTPRLDSRRNQDESLMRTRRGIALDRLVEDEGVAPLGVLVAPSWEESAMSTAASRPPKVPPPWFVHTAWRVHRALYRLSGGRFLWTTSNKRGWGALHLTTMGRKSGRARGVIIGYLEDGPNLVSVAMNGWDEGHPSWWLNLQVHPDAVVRLPGQHPRAVRARLA